MDVIKVKSKMVIEIWGDIICPFCYIGKRNFDKALQLFKHNEEVDIIWKSYQLDPLRTGSENVYDYLQDKKGISREQAVTMQNEVATMAKHEGLDFQIDKIILANTLKGHKLIRIAKERGFDSSVWDLLFSLNFSDGQDVSDDNVLIKAAEKIGLSGLDFEEAMTNKKYEDIVNKDMQDAREKGVTGVPYFLFNDKHIVNGARQTEIFLEVLNNSFIEWKRNDLDNNLHVTTGAFCDTDDRCDIN